MPPISPNAHKAASQATKPNDNKLAKLLLGVLLAFGALYLSACKDEANAESSALDSSELDKKSYAGLEDVFADTSDIRTNGKYMLLVFGANGCKYCENLKNDIKNDEGLKAYLKEHFSAYYINTSYRKMHQFSVGEKGAIKDYALSTRKLAEIYRIGPTPTLVFATKEGKTIIAYPSYLPPKQLKALLRFVNEGAWEKAGDDNAKLQQALQTYLQNEA